MGFIEWAESIARKYIAPLRDVTPLETKRLIDSDIEERKAALAALENEVASLTEEIAVRAQSEADAQAAYERWRKEQRGQ